MLSMSPLYGTLLAFILSIFLMLGLIWTPKLAHEDQKYTCPLIAGIRGGFFIAMAYYGLLFLDIVVKVGILGIIGFGNISYFLDQLILFAVFGIVLIIGTTFTAPTVKTLLTFITVLGTSIYYFYFSGELGLSEDGWYYIPLFLPFGVQVGLTILEILIRAIMKKPAFQTTPLWDISQKFKHRINKKAIIIFWFLFSLELILMFEGLNILFWLPL